MTTWKVASNSGLVASGGANAQVEVPVHPPVEWFGQISYGGPTPVQFSDEGMVSGHIAAWGTSHTGFANKHVPVPRSACNYAKFATGFTKCEGGQSVPTGRLFIDTVHPNLAYVASDAQAHYADTGCAVADIAIFEDEWGIAISGALRPTVTEGQLRIARGSDWSGDWRAFNGQLELVAVLAVNQGGFIVDGLVASGGEVVAEPVTASRPMVRFDMTTDQPTALVAAGAIRRAGPASEQQIDVLMSEIAELKATVFEQGRFIKTVRADKLRSKFQG